MFNLTKFIILLIGMFIIYSIGPNQCYHKDNSHFSANTFYSSEVKLISIGDLSVFPKTVLALQSPFKSKPDIEWRNEYNLANLPGLSLDRNFNIVFSSGNLILDNSKIPYDVVTKLCKVNMNGKTVFEKTLKDDLMFEPLGFNNDGIITYRWKNNEDNLDEYQLVCIDDDANAIWTTQGVNREYSYPAAFLISDSQLMMSVGELSGLNFNIYNMQSGELIKKIKFQTPPELDYDANNILNTMKMKRLSNGEWLGIINNNIVKYNSDFTLKWMYQTPKDKEFPDLDIIYRAFICNDKYIMISIMKDLYIINLDSGELLKEFKSMDTYIAAGITKAGSFIYYMSDDEGRVSYINEINLNGTLLRTKKIKYVQQDVYTVIYPDGSIIYTCEDGITMLDEKFNFVWKIGNEELSISKEYILYHWKIIPTINNRLICYFAASGNRKEISYLVSLKSTE